MKHVWSSPFRRCLETAGVVARTLGLSTVNVHYGLGEAVWYVRAYLEQALDEGEEGDIAADGSGRYYLTPEQQAAAVGEGVSIVLRSTVHEDDSPLQTTARFIRAFDEVLACAEMEGGGDAVVVTHGCALEAAGVFAKPSMHLSYSDFCAHVAVMPDKSLQHSYCVHGRVIAPK